MTDDNISDYLLDPDNTFEDLTAQILAEARREGRLDQLLASSDDEVAP